MARSVKIEAKQRRQASNRSALAAHIQKALVLAGKAGGRQVFGRRRAAHRDRDPGAAFLFESAIGRGDLGTKMRGTGGLVNQPAGGGGALGEQCDIVVVEGGEKATQFVLDTGRGERVAVGSGGQREAFGHSDPLGREHRIKLAKRRGLAADFGNVAQPDIAEPADIRLCRHRMHSPRELASWARGKAICVDADQRGAGRSAESCKLSFANGGLL